MTSPAARALAVDLRHSQTGALLGVALLTPSRRHATVFADGGTTVERALGAEVWQDIDQWASVGDAGLPKRPAPLSQPVIDALVAQHAAKTVGRRFASIPLTDEDAAALPSIAERLLPRLFAARKSAAA